MSLPAEIAAGVRAFNARDYFDAHEHWEDHWGHGSPAERSATLGLIKAAVALHHLERANIAGFQWQAEQSLSHLRDNAAVWPQLQLVDLAEALDSLLAQIRFLRDTIPSHWERPTLPTLP